MATLGMIIIGLFLVMTAISTLLIRGVLEVVFRIIEFIIVYFSKKDLFSRVEYKEMDSIGDDKNGDK